MMSYGELLRNIINELHFNYQMAQKIIPPKISVYFVEEEDKPLYDKLEELIKEKKVSKNRAIIEIIRNYFDNQIKPICETVNEERPIYDAAIYNKDINELKNRLNITETDLEILRAELNLLKNKIK